MTVHRLLPYRWRSRLDAARHAEAVAGVLDTPAIEPRRDGLVLFSMIGTLAVLPYLVAVKTLWRQLGRGRVVLLDDGTLTAEDRALLAHHCGDPEIVTLASVSTDPFPRGGTWERFLTILDRREGEYWVQLDSDTVTLGPLDEVADAIARNRSFTLLGGAEAEIGPLPCAEFARRLYPDGPAEGHVQQRVESRLAEGPKGTFYIRGCSGFAGFAAGGAGRELARTFLAAMERFIGREALSLWGTEQLASNFQIANETAPVLLPYARYLNYWGEAWGEDARFVHFVGTHRHDHGAYAEVSRIAIEQLRGRTS